MTAPSKTVLAVMCLLLAMAPAASAQNDSAQTAEKRYKNIRVLNDIPADELIPAMDFIRGALGVQCTFCHVQNGAFPQGYEKDDKKEKQTAREMMKMVRQINASSFAGRTEVTCATCHNGHPLPQSYTPVLSANDVKQRATAPSADAAAALPAAEELFARYVQAIGGDAAISKLSSRHIVSTLTTGSGQTTSLEAFYKPGNLFWQQVGPAGSGRIVASDGKQVWTSAPSVHVMTGLDAEDVKLAGQFYRVLRPQDFYERARTEQKEMLDGKEVYVVRAEVRGERYSDLLYFDTSSGLLLRRVTLTRTVFGQSAQRTDFANYVAVDGLKTAMDLTISTPWDAPRKVHFDQVQFNMPVDDSKFAMPPALPAGK